MARGARLPLGEGRGEAECSPRPLPQGLASDVWRRGGRRLSPAAGWTREGSLTSWGP